MSKKHFELIAAILREAKAVSSLPGEVDRISVMFARMLPSTNENFDVQRFLRACGYGA
jgi:hypothetical protein